MRRLNQSYAVRLVTNDDITSDNQWWDSTGSHEPVLGINPENRLLNRCPEDCDNERTCGRPALRETVLMKSESHHWT